jgi:type I restriction enzyme, S subunit
VTKNLGELCTFQGGSQPPKSNFIYEPKEGYIRFLQIRDFGSEKNHTYIPIDKKNKTCNQDDIMIGRYGASVGKILRGRYGAYNVALMKATPNVSLINKEYYWHYLNSSLFQENLSKVASRSAQDGFSKDDIFNFQIPLPPLPIQQKIVAKLDAIFAELMLKMPRHYFKVT